MKLARLVVAPAIVLALTISVPLVGVAGQQRNSAEPVKPPAKEWKMAELLPKILSLGSGHDWEQGRTLFKDAACGACHAFGRESQGTGLAPDLTGVWSKFTPDLVLQSILEPSATINGQFFQTTFVLKNGDIITGSIVETTDNTIVVAPAVIAPQVTVEIRASDVKSQEPSEVSPMPVGLLNQFTEAQVVELFAFLAADGDRSAAVYNKK